MIIILQSDMNFKFHVHMSEATIAVCLLEAQLLIFRHMSQTSPSLTHRMFSFIGPPSVVCRMV